MTRDDRVIMMLGEMRGDMRGLQRSVDGMSNRMELQRQALEQQGIQIAALPCHHHRKQLSDLFKAVGQVRQITGVHHIAELERARIWKSVWAWTWRIGRIAVPAILAGGGLAAALAAMQCTGG